MAPVEILINLPNRPTEVLSARENRPVTLDTIPSVTLKISTINDDRTGKLKVEGPAEVVKVTKHTSERDKVGSTQDITSPIMVSGPETIIVSSPYYGEIITISHKSFSGYSFYGNPRNRV